MDSVTREGFRVVNEPTSSSFSVGTASLVFDHNWALLLFEWRLSRGRTKHAQSTRLNSPKT